MLDELFRYWNHPLSVMEEHLRSLSPSELAWSPSGGKNTIGWLLAHMLGTEDYWIHQLAFDRPVAQPTDLSNATALLTEYRRVREATRDRVLSATPEELKRIIAVPAFSDGWRAPFPPTLLWVIHHVFEHEAYHVGQVSMLLRQQGLKPLPF